MYTYTCKLPSGGFPRNSVVKITEPPDITSAVYSGCRGAQWPSGRASDSGAIGRGFDTYLRRVVSFSKAGLPRSGKKVWKLNFFPGQGKVREFQF